VAVGFLAAKWLLQKDEETEQRRRGAAKLAAVLTSLGLKRLPDLLTDYSVGDYSGMAHKIGETSRLFLEGEEAVVKEFETVFQRVLDVRLRTEAGRALIAAKLADTVKATDPSLVSTSVASQAQAAAASISASSRV
jgi:hypothetical protein